MKTFQPSTPRATFGLFAAAMTALTIAIAVVAPAKMDVSSQQERFAAGSRTTHTHAALVSEALQYARQS